MYPFLQCNIFASSSSSSFPFSLFSYSSYLPLFLPIFIPSSFRRYLPLLSPFPFLSSLPPSLFSLPSLPFPFLSLTLLSLARLLVTLRPHATTTVAGLASTLRLGSVKTIASLGLACAPTFWKSHVWCATQVRRGATISSTSYAPHATSLSYKSLN